MSSEGRDWTMVTLRLYLKMSLLLIALKTLVTCVFHSVVSEHTLTMMWIQELRDHGQFAMSFTR